MKNCAGPCLDHNSCNWLEGMVRDAGGVCPHCGGPVTDIPTVTPAGRMMDVMSLDAPPGTW